MEGVGSSSASSGSNNPKRPLCLIVLGMAGSGKTTFIKKLVEHLDSFGNQTYTINLDPAVFHVPYRTNIDIRDTVKFKELMKQYGFGPNGAIMTALNFFTAHFDKVVNLISKKADQLDHVIIDTPGQIEVFTWSASGVIITETLSTSFPTIIVYVMDTPRSHNPTTFMSNMLYACSVLYRMKLPFICVLNKTDIIDCAFAIEWMSDFEAFQTALSVHRSAGGMASDTFDVVDGPGVECDSSQYMTGLTSSMSLVLDEFYNGLKCCGVSSINGDGFPKFMELVESAAEEYFTDFLPALKLNQQSTGDRKEPSLLTVENGSASLNELSSSLLDKTEDGCGVSMMKGKLHDSSGHKMLIDLVGNSDNADLDPLANIDGIEEQPDIQISDRDFLRQCYINPKQSTKKMD